MVVIPCPTSGWLAVRGERGGAIFIAELVSFIDIARSSRVKDIHDFAFGVVYSVSSRVVRGGKTGPAVTFGAFSPWLRVWDDVGM